MTRYLFEFLAYIEKNGKKAYSIRELSDCLCISGSVVSKCMGTVDDSRARRRLLHKAVPIGGAIQRPLP